MTNKQWNLQGSLPHAKDTQHSKVRGLTNKKTMTNPGAYKLREEGD